MERGSDAEAQGLRTLMVSEHARLVAQVATLTQTFDELVAAADLEPPDDEHDPDGTTAYERAQVTSLRSEAEGSIAALEAALTLVDAGTYGACSACGAAIPIERLEAVLGTDRCVACASGKT